MRAFSRPVLAGVSVGLPSAHGRAPIQLPEECACCAAVATHPVALDRKDGLSLLVGYCDKCAEHQASASSRVLASALSSLLLALVGAAGLPLIAPFLGMVGLVLSVIGLSLLPFGLLYLPAPPSTFPHSARGAAVHWLASGRLWCASLSYAEHVRELNDVDLRAEPLGQAMSSPWLSAGPVLGIGAACLSFFVYHPLLRIINLGSSRIEVALDDRRLSAIDPTSNESPAAGALLRVPAGAHWLSVTSAVDGASLARVRVDFRSSAAHLFAFAADDVCFWLETTGYGKERLEAPSYRPLPSADRFWVLPDGIDTWFAPNPSAADRKSGSSGGLLTALRQARCAEAPPEARSPPQ